MKRLEASNETWVQIVEIWLKGNGNIMENLQSLGEKNCIISPFWPSIFNHFSIWNPALMNTSPNYIRY